MKTNGISIFETLPKQQLEFLELAAGIEGFRSLTDFMLNAVQKRAVTIIEGQQKVISSEKDRNMFFEELLHPKETTPELQKAAATYLEKSSAWNI